MYWVKFWKIFFPFYPKGKRYASNFFFSENVDEIVNSHSFGGEPALLWAEYNLIESAHNLHWVALVICILVNLMFHR